MTTLSDKESSVLQAVDSLKNVPLFFQNNVKRKYNPEYDLEMFEEKIIPKEVFLRHTLNLVKGIGH